MLRLRHGQNGMFLLLRTAAILLGIGGAWRARPQQAQKTRPTAAAVLLESSRYTDFSALASACVGAPSCVVDVRGPQSMALSGVTRVPPNLHLRFEPGGLWQLAGGSLDFAGATPEAPIDRQIFSGTGRVTGLGEARPEWFVTPVADGDVEPASALAVAYAATVPGATLRLNARRYLSPFTFVPGTTWPAAPPQFPRMAYDSPRTFLGAGRPLPDNETAPTRLTGGTVLLGQVVGTVPMVALHLGVDDGPTAAAYFGGFRGNGLALMGPRHLAGGGTRFEDVSVLTTGVEGQHSVMVEGQHDATIKGLWIWTLGGLHGLVMKSSHSTVSDFHCAGASDCLILKSDFATDRGGYAANDTLTGIDIHALARPGDTGGIVIDSTWDTVHDVSLTDVHLDGTAFGLVAQGSPFHTLRNVRLDGWTVRETRGRCVELHYAAGVDVSDFGCSLAPLAIPAAFVLDGSKIRLRNVAIDCSGYADACLATGTTGIALLSNDATLQHVTGTQLGGALVRSVTPLSEGNREQLSTMNMLGPLAAAYTAPRQSMAERLRRWKPPLRIAYTYTLTNLGGQQRAVWLALALCGAMATFFVWRRRRRRQPEGK